MLELVAQLVRVFNKSDHEYLLFNSRMIILGRVKHIIPKHIGANATHFQKMAVSPLRLRRQLAVHLLRPLYRHRLSTLSHACKDDNDDGTNPSFIHPTSVVHPDAIIGQGVSIGPFCTVGSSVMLGNHCKLHPGSHVFGNTKLGDKCILMSGAVVGDNIPGKTIIGCNNVIGHHAVVGIKCQDMKYKSGNECFLQVGDNNEIREHVSIHRSSKPCDRTVIGDNNLIMGSCHIAHDCKVGSNNIFANNTLLAGHVLVEDHTHTAGAIVVHQFCNIGSFCFIGGGSVVSQDVPKYTMVAGDRAELRGLNLEGLRRSGFSVSEIRSLRAAYRKIFMPTNASLGGIEDRLADVECHKDLSLVPAVLSFVQSIRESLKEGRRGICKFRSWSFS
ncbi:putative acyl-[acyl-carrier-protein]--UDP-N-acetylglucosamine O-acyltransferase [Helianthus annuus]|nr:putative acyl-[acyl-carrier-protein]--UDP-N-acetylglucosamine O-acyltransferase [Helianthus annuus]KAJ0864769.1 putative acyl-[acyl-carrier-protein]--UDP-N-acetylglucosamine O-acyltransferase [Helianthus annuus]